jgi:hypothetical protein
MELYWQKHVSPVFLDGPSVVICVDVVAWTVVIKASTIPKLSLITLAKGAKQFVVQEALETTKSEALALSWFTP